jgi:molybdopterin converting factor small subunit
MSIEVRVRFFGASNSDFKRLSVEEGSKNLRSLLKSLAKEKATEYIRDGCVVSINKKLVTNDVELKDRDEIIIMPMLHGG